jgi:protein-tyrosine phosphatase
MRKVNMSELIGGRLYLHSMPGRYESWSNFILSATDLGVTHILCLAPDEEIKKKSPDYHQALIVGEHPFKIYHFPIKDYGVPSVAEIPELINILGKIQRLLKAEQAVLIHCAGGIGRTGMITALLLVYLGHTVEEAIRIIKNAGSSAETDEQKSFFYQVGSFQVGAIK